jgi:NAD dependent epimerase/dehydratase family enzyme
MEQGEKKVLLPCGEGFIASRKKCLEHCRWDEHIKREIKDSRVRTTRRIAKAINSLPKNKRPKVFVSSSAVGFYGTSQTGTFDERSENGSDYLAEVCREWEAAANEADTRVVIVRTGIVLSTQGGALAKMMPIFNLFGGVAQQFFLCTGSELHEWSLSLFFVFGGACFLYLAERSENGNDYLAEVCREWEAAANEGDTRGVIVWTGIVLSGIVLSGIVLSGIMLSAIVLSGIVLFSTRGGALAKMMPTFN